MIELKAKISGLSIFQLQEVDRHVKARMSTFGIPVHAPGGRTAFKHGDMIEFTAKSGARIRAIVERLNDKTVGCRDVATGGKWRVSYGLARLVGADKPSGLVGLTPHTIITDDVAMTPRPPSAGAASTAAGAGGW